MRTIRKSHFMRKIFDPGVFVTPRRFYIVKDWMIKGAAKPSLYGKIADGLAQDRGQ